MENKIIVVLSLLAASALSPLFAAFNDESPSKISAYQIRHGCDLSFDKKFYPNDTHALGTPPHDTIMNWVCQGNNAVEIDRYEVEGTSPRIATVFFWKNKGLIVLVKWTINSRASDFQGEFYKIYVYKYDGVSHSSPFMRQDKIMSEFGPGWDGLKDGFTVTYQFKDAASIRTKLSQLRNW
jgi:hypothetical protein